MSTPQTDSIAAATASFRWLLMKPTGSGMAFRDPCHSPALEVLYRAMQLLEHGDENEELLSCLALLVEPPGIGHVLRSAVADALLEVAPLADDPTEAEMLRLGYAKRLLGHDLAALRQRVCDIRSCGVSERLRAAFVAALGEPERFWTALDLPLDHAGREGLRDWMLRSDRFSVGEAFRATVTAVLPSAAAKTRPLERLYGYRQEKARFSDQFEPFAQGRAMPPLALWGLPGLGKTHFAIAYTRAFDCVLVTADEKVLENGLERVLVDLGRYPHRRFVLFFDDIETEQTDWGMFRHQISGHLPYPVNVLTILASNYPFPPSVRSRCAMLSFRPIDPVVCAEIVEDYLHKQMGLSGDHRRLAKVIVADYVNEYVQHQIIELSPRTLIRYLELLEADSTLRARLLEESLVDPIRVPTADMFMESHKLLHRLFRRDPRPAAR